MTAQQLSPDLEECGNLEKCPFLDPAHGLCRATLLRFIPEPRQLSHYCFSDDHDDCPVFLAKALRCSSPGGQSRDAAALCKK